MELKAKIDELNDELEGLNLREVPVTGRPAVRQYQTELRSELNRKLN